MSTGLVHHFPTVNWSSKILYSYQMRWLIDCVLTVLALHSFVIICILVMKKDLLLKLYILVVAQTKVCKHDSNRSGIT